jgi:hypothetical protein
MTPPRHLWSGDWRRESAAAARELARRRGEGDQASARPEPASAPLGTPRPEQTASLPRPPQSEQTASLLRDPRPEPAAAPAPAPPPKPPLPPKPAALPRPAKPAPRPKPGLASGARSAGPTASARAPRRRSRPSIPRPLPRGWQLAIGAALLALVITAGAVALTGPRGSGGSSGTPWLGLQVAPNPVPDGALVQSVSPGSPADQAGLQPGDVITQIGEQPVNSPGDVRALIAGRRPGDQVEIGIERGALTYTTDATLAPRPAGSQ